MKSYKNNNTLLGGQVINEIAEILKRNKFVMLDLKNIEFADKVAMLLMDYIIYDYLKTPDNKLLLSTTIKNSNNPWAKIAETNSMICKKKYQNNKLFINNKNFINEYTTKINSNKTYRLYAKREEILDFKSRIEIINEFEKSLSTYINTLKTADKNKVIDLVKHILQEILGNTFEHGSGEECVVDFCYRSNMYWAKTNEDIDVIELTIIAPSDEKLYTGLRKHLSDEKFKKISPIHEFITMINEKDKNHPPEIVQMWSCLQSGISTRPSSMESNTGGTGLDIMVDSMIKLESIEQNFSYIYSGNHILPLSDNNNYSLGASNIENNDMDGFELNLGWMLSEYFFDGIGYQLIFIVK